MQDAVSKVHVNSTLHINVQMTPNAAEGPHTHFTITCVYIAVPNNPLPASLTIAIMIDKHISNDEVPFLLPFPIPLPTHTRAVPHPPHHPPHHHPQHIQALAFPLPEAPPARSIPRAPPRHKWRLKEKPASRPCVENQVEHAG